MKEFKYRTDLLNAQAICFVFGLNKQVFKVLRANGFPEPEYFCNVPQPGVCKAPRKVVYWRRSVVKLFMQQNVHPEKVNDMCIGLKDKLYWRPMTRSSWCCLKKSANVKGYTSLCGRFTSSLSGGQQCARPPAYMRCAQCDVAEMKRRGKEESLRSAPNWREHQL